LRGPRRFSLVLAVEGPGEDDEDDDEDKDQEIWLRPQAAL